MANTAVMKRIRSKNISVIIPTFKRKENIKKIISLICSKCTIEGMNIIVIDDDVDSANEEIISNESHVQAKEKGHTVIEVKNTGVHGVTPSRNLAFKEALKINSTNIIYLDDDAFPGKECFERLLAVQLQEPRFAVVGVVGAFKRFMKDIQKDEVRFRAAFGVCYSFNAEAVRAVGLPDTNVKVRTDVEYLLRMWQNGYWTAIVHAPISHKRFSKREDGDHLPDNRSGDWIPDVYYIAEKYKDLVRPTKSGCLIPRFKYPTIRYYLDEDMLLRHEGEGTEIIFK